MRTTSPVFSRHGYVLTTAPKPPGEPVQTGAGAHLVRRPQDHVTLEDVACENRLDVVHRAIHIRKLDRSASAAMASAPPVSRPLLVDRAP
jgi:hypothetical protein